MKVLFKRAEDDTFSISEIETIYYQGGEMVIRSVGGKERCCPMSKKMCDDIVVKALQEDTLDLSGFYFRVDFRHIHIFN